MFVFFNDTKQRVDFEIFNLDNWDWSGCLDKARKSAKTGKWLGLYRLPGGCKKVDYYWPQILKTTKTMIEGEFCTDCSWWGEYAPFQLDLEHKRYRHLKINLKMS